MTVDPATLVQHHDFHARLENVTDGDTVELLVDSRCRNRSSPLIRLSDVYAPELKYTEGKAARQYVVDWFGGMHVHTTRPAVSPSWPWFVITEKDRQTFNRYIGVVWCRVCGASLNEDVNTWLASQPAAFRKRYRTLALLRHPDAPWS